MAKVAPQEGKPVKAAAPQGAPAGCRRRSGKEGVRALSKTGDPLRAGRASNLAATVAGRLLPVLPHDPGPAVDPKNKVAMEGPAPKTFNNPHKHLNELLTKPEGVRNKQMFPTIKTKKVS